MPTLTHLSLPDAADFPGATPVTPAELTARFPGWSDVLTQAESAGRLPDGRWVVVTAEAVRIYPRDAERVTRRVFDVLCEVASVAPPAPVARTAR